MTAETLFASAMVRAIELAQIFVCGQAVKLSLIEDAIGVFSDFGPSARAIPNRLPARLVIEVDGRLDKGIGIHIETGDIGGQERGHGLERQLGLWRLGDCVRSDRRNLRAVSL